MSDIGVTIKLRVNVPESEISDVCGADDGSDEWYSNACKRAEEICEDGPWAYGNWVVGEEVEAD